MEELSKVFRQKDDSRSLHVYQSRGFRRLADFIDMLCGMRIGKLKEAHVQEFFKLSRTLHYEDGIEPTYLYAYSSVPRLDCHST